MVNPLQYLTDTIEFPPVNTANEDGLLAAGGDLAINRLILAYKSGIFPWFEDDRLPLWWSPDPRMVLFPNELKVSKSMRKLLRDKTFSVTKNTCFSKIIHECATMPRDGQAGTWITKKMQNAYLELHHIGMAHSYEVWLDAILVGGLYGIDLGTVFCGESMFSKVSNASKYGFITMVQELAAQNYKLIDCQVYTEHLESLGAREIDRDSFLKFLD